MIRTQIPVLTGFGYNHIMCEAEIVEEDDNVTVTMTANGKNASELMAIMTAGEPMALSFVAIPVIPRRPRSIKENL